LDARKEPRNIFDILLLLAGLLFVITALAVAFIPVLEEKARDAGSPPPPSPFRDALRQDGVYWLLYELAALVVFGLASMVLDYLRRLQKERASAKIAASEETNQSP
jgi:amino acid transporter